MFAPWAYSMMVTSDLGELKISWKAMMLGCSRRRWFRISRETRCAHSKLRGESPAKKTLLTLNTLPTRVLPGLSFAWAWETLSESAFWCPAEPYTCYGGTCACKCSGQGEEREITVIYSQGTQPDSTPATGSLRNNRMYQCL